MQMRTIGDTDLVCSALGFGTWAMGTTQYGEIDEKEASHAVGAAIDFGINLFDTAEVYGPFHAEKILSEALGPRRKDVILVTKVGFDYDDEGKIIGRNSRREHILARTEGCLERLGTDWIDLLLIHWPDHDTPFEEPIRALEELKTAGKIRYYGVSNFDVAMMEDCQNYGDLAANQIGYHLFDRRVETQVLPYCAGHNIGFMAYGTLGYGLLTGSFTAETTFVDWDWRSHGQAFGLPLFEREHFVKELRVVEGLMEIAASHHKTVAQLAIAWVLSRAEVSVALVGVRNEAELQENVQAVDWTLDEEDKAAIDALFERETVPTYSDAPIAI